LSLLPFQSNSHVFGDWSGVFVVGTRQVAGEDKAHARITCHYFPITKVVQSVLQMWCRDSSGMCGCWVIALRYKSLMGLNGMKFGYVFACSGFIVFPEACSPMWKKVVSITLHCEILQM
jgi:hypothetical protein